jgi:hypothetical protein
MVAKFEGGQTLDAHHGTFPCVRQCLSPPPPSCRFHSLYHTEFSAFCRCRREKGEKQPKNRSRLIDTQPTDALEVQHFHKYVIVPLHMYLSLAAEEWQTAAFPPSCLPAWRCCVVREDAGGVLCLLLPSTSPHVCVCVSNVWYNNPSRKRCHRVVSSCFFCLEK